MTKQISVLEFFKQFPDDDTCLEHLMNVRYGKEFNCPKCEKASKFHRVTKRPVYGCQYCGHQISPMAGTPFARSSTPLQKWFYAVYLFTTTRHGVPAKELQRQLSVTYKTAWRMGHEIRKYMGKVDGDDGLSGHVEIDETYIGGKHGQRGRPNPKTSHKTVVFGMVERGGKIMTKVVSDVKRSTLVPIIKDNVEQGTTLSTDEMTSYWYLYKQGFKHGMVSHGQEEWVNGIHHTNTIESFWARLKLSIRGTHVHVSKKYMANYLAEFEYRYNMRGENAPYMFNQLLQSF
ncbi:MAG: IS1595 family transposase [Pseudohongiellaceae bacterium]